MPIPVLMNCTTNILDISEKISEVLVCADSNFAKHLRRVLTVIFRIAIPTATM
jgi:hypothetical protein